jgi:hypothetical protein
MDALDAIAAEGRQAGAASGRSGGLHDTGSAPRGPQISAPRLDLGPGWQVRQVLPIGSAQNGLKELMV